MSVQGLPELLKKFDDLGKQGVRVAKASISAVADLIVADAKQAAPAAFGRIRQGIGKEQIDELLFSVYSSAPESAFQEFGTGGKVEVPSEMADVASQFQGANGGGMKAFIESLVDWVKLRGLVGVYSVKTHRRSNSSKYGDNDKQDLAAAWAIAKTILKNGLKPQPFLYPAFVNQSAKLVPMLQTALQELLRENQA